MDLTKKQKKIENYILFMLARRDYTEQELLFKLKNKPYYDESLANTIINQFKEKNYISEKRCAESLTHSMYQNLYGFNKIIEKARLRHIDIKLITKECEEFDFYETCYKFLCKNRHINKIDDFKIKTKIVSNLIGRGFSFDQINNAIERLKNESNILN